MVISLIIILGLIFGSFVSMASYELGAKDGKLLNIIIRRSFCPKCNNILKIKNLFPVLSWLFQRGRCSFCHSKISYRYVLTEILCVVLFVTSYFALGQKLDIHLYLILTIIVILMVASIVDLEHYFIPNITQIILIILAVFYHIFVTNNVDIKTYLISGFLYGLFIYFIFYIFLIIRGRCVIGSDDLKFFPIAGLFLGLENFVYFIAFLGIFGIICGTGWKFFKQENCFPFAPALSLSLMTNLWGFNKLFDLTDILECVILECVG